MARVDLRWSQVGLAHEKLTDVQAAARRKAFWRDRLDVLTRLLES
jgi:hypothetical protein